MRSAIAGRAAGPIPAIALAAIILTLTSGSRSADRSASSAGAALGPESRSAIAARPRRIGSSPASERAREETSREGSRRGAAFEAEARDKVVHPVQAP